MEENIYTEQIAPKIKEIRDICLKERIPYFTFFLLPDGSKKVSTLTQAMLNIDPDEESIQHFMNILNGFTTVPPSQITEIDFPAPF